MGKMKEIAQAIDEFAPLFDQLTTSDLQGICEARAMKITGSSDPLVIMEVSDMMLRGINEIGGQ